VLLALWEYQGLTRRFSNLAQLYRQVGREEDARKIEDELLKLLAYADPDYPLLVQLKSAQSAARNPSTN